MFAYFLWLLVLTIHGSKVTEFPFHSFFELNADTHVEPILKSTYLCSLQSQNRCCSCSDECPKFKSCCIDKYWSSFQQNSPLATTNEDVLMDFYLEYFFKKMQEKKKWYTCTELVPRQLLQKIDSANPTTNFFMVAKCSQAVEVMDNPVDVLYCQEPSPNIIFNFIPVQGSNGKIYRNSACARCNNVHNYSALPIEAQCGYTNDVSLRALAECEFSLTKRFEGFKCTKSTFRDSECSNWSLRRKCSLYQGTLGEYEGPTYQNYHCFKCMKGHQNDSIKMLHLRKSCRTGGEPIYWSMLIAYSQKLTYIRPYDGKILKTEEKCSSQMEQVFDVFSKRCYNKSELQHFSHNKNFSSKLNRTTIGRRESKTREHTIYHNINMGVFFSGSIISILCYSGILFTYGFFKELQNIHGYNIIAMCSFLLAADLFMLLVNAASCYVIGVLLHYVILTSQMWVTIICFDIAFSFHSDLTVPSKKEQKMRVFGKYLCIATMGPLLVIIPALVLEKLGIIGTGYINSCFLNAFTARMAFYILPIAIMDLLSMGALIKTFLKIHKDKKETSKALQTNQNQVNVLQMAFRLMLGLGIIECLGFIQINENTSVFDYVSAMVYNIIRSFGGVFVFFVFVANKKIVTLYRRPFALLYSEKRKHDLQMN